MSAGLKGRFPFRFGTSSYIVPDDILPNVRYLADKVDDIELVLFESDEISNIPDEATVSTLAAIAEESNLTYTVHLPLDAYLGHADEDVRVASIGKCKRIVERVEPLRPHGYLLHFHGDRRGRMPSDDLPRWLDNHRRSLDVLCESVGPEALCVETLDYPFALVEDVVIERGLSVCLDIGHLLLGGYSVEEHLDRHLARTRVLHVHGVADGRDHLDLSHLDPAVLEDLVRRLEADGSVTRVFTAEIFSEEDFDASRRVMERYATWRG